MVGQRSDRHSIGSPLIVSIEIITSRGEQAKFVVEGELEFLVCQREIIDLRTGLVHFRDIQFANTKDHRVVLRGLMVIDEQRIETCV